MARVITEHDGPLRRQPIRSQAGITVEMRRMEGADCGDVHQEQPGQQQDGQSSGGFGGRQVKRAAKGLARAEAMEHCRADKQEEEAAVIADAQGGEVVKRQERQRDAVFPADLARAEGRAADNPEAERQEKGMRKVHDEHGRVQPDAAQAAAQPAPANAQQEDGQQRAGGQQQSDVAVVTEEHAVNHAEGCLVNRRGLLQRRPETEGGMRGKRLHQRRQEKERQARQPEQHHAQEEAHIVGQSGFDFAPS